MTLCNKRATNYYRRSNCVFSNVNCVKTELESTGAAILNRVIDRSWRTLSRRERNSAARLAASLFVNVFVLKMPKKRISYIEMRFLIYIIQSSNGRRQIK